jgi:GNAT superfamily N-acetyltransferase
MALTIRRAVPVDVPLILRFIVELATYEMAEHEVEATEESLVRSIFGEGSVTKAAICEDDGEPVGFCIWFYNYSTWQAKKGLYLEDLYVSPSHRGRGAGKLLLKYLARTAVEEDCGRFEWSVLTWNEPAIRVYESMGAEPQSEWMRYRLAGDALKTFADG